MSHAAPLLLTGASSGIGLGAALSLAGRYPLILPVRSAARGVELSKRLMAVHPNANIQTPICDLASLGSVQAFAEQLTQEALSPPLAGIACIAGVQIVQGLQRSVEGHELTFAVHHLAHSLLVLRLLDHLALGASVLFVGSSTHNAGDFWARLFGFKGGRFTSVEALARGESIAQGRETAIGNERYATAKLCNLMTMHGLSREMPADKVRFCAVDPGLVPGTGLARENTALNRIGWSAMRHVFPLFPGVSKPLRSGATIAWALTAPDLAGRSGLHFNYRAEPSETSAESRDPALTMQLLSQTRSLLRLGGFL